MCPKHFGRHGGRTSTILYGGKISAGFRIRLSLIEHKKEHTQEYSLHFSSTLSSAHLTADKNTQNIKRK